MIILFSISTMRYIFYRYHLTVLINKDISYFKELNDNDDDDTDDNNTDIDNWLKKNEQVVYNSEKGDIIEINENDNDVNCRKNMMKKITIPSDFKTEIYSNAGVKLESGHSYCVNVSIPSHSKTCDEVWGFWHFSEKFNKWMCKSKVPGIYNAIKNTFDDSCQNGTLLYDGQEIDKTTIPQIFTPLDFYSKEFQQRFECKCARGFLSAPELSRTTCFKDPCLLELPKNAAAPGYKEGLCDCGDHFVNMYRDKNYPCTACPYNSPEFDKKTNTLTVYIKCYNDDKDFGLYPCKSQEDKIRGCMKAKIKVKPMDIKKETTFEELIFY